MSKLDKSGNSNLCTELRREIATEELESEPVFPIVLAL